MTKYQIIYWRDIPVSVRVKQDGLRRSESLSGRFQQAVHRAAYRGKAITGEAYMREWQPSEWHDERQSPEEVLRLVMARLEAAFPDERLEKLARNSGYETNDD